MSLSDPAAAGLLEHRETYDVVGEVVGWVRDLETAWRDEESRAPVLVTADEAAWSTSYILPAPPAIAWEWITSPARRPQWQVGVTAVEEASTSGRRGVGTTNHCVHGREAIVEEVLAWRPPELLTVRFQVPMPGIPKFTLSDILEPTPDGAGTRVSVRVLRPSSAKDRAKLEEIGPLLAHSFEGGIAPLQAALEADVAARAAAAARETPEPDLPVSAQRNIAAPVATAVRNGDATVTRST
ncbi:MAG: SRPBCC family protein [Chloroflexi bacterium]|nr:SRPBCC family protein [Chloroflexota bacterium]